MDCVAKNVQCDHLKTSGSVDYLSPLPLDLLLHLFSLLDPLDIIALRKVRLFFAYPILRKVLIHHRRLKLFMNPRCNARFG